MSNIKLSFSARILPWVALAIGTVTIIAAMQQPLKQDSLSAVAIFYYILGGITALGGIISLVRFAIGFWIIFFGHLIQIIQYISPDYLLFV